MNERLKILKDIFGYSGSAVLAQGFGLISSFVVARTLGPSDFGVWNVVLLALVYGAYFDFGILPAMGRDIPIYRGKGDLNGVQELETTALVCTLISSLLVAVILIGLSFWSNISPEMAFGLRGMSMVSFLQRLYVYYQTVLRSNNEFRLLSWLQVLFAVQSTALILVLVVWLGFEGRVAAAVLSQLIILVCVLRLRKWKYKVSFALDCGLTFRLAKVGFPIILSSAVIGLLTTVDRLMVVKYLGKTELGYFGVALMVASVVSLIPSMASQVLYPRIAHRYGESGNSIPALRNFVLMPSVLLSLLLPLLIGPLYLILPITISNLLPAYVPGIQAARLVLLGIFFFSVIGLMDYFLVTTGRLREYVLFGVLALGINVSLDVLFIKAGTGIEGVALGGTLITYLCYSTMLIGYALSHYARTTYERVKFFIKLYAPFAYMLLLLALIEWLIQFPNRSGLTNAIFSVTARITLFILGCVPLMYEARRQMRMESAWLH